MPDSGMGERFCLYDSQELEAVLASMARQLASLLYGQPFALVGILRRGVPLARMLQKHYCSQTGESAPSLYTLKVKRYAYGGLLLIKPNLDESENAETL